MKSPALRMTLCPKERRSELERVKGSERTQAQQAGGQFLDRRDIDDHVAGRDEMVHAPLGEARAVLSRICSRASLRNADTTSTDVRVQRTISESAASQPSARGKDS
jgi:hypothetical protein